MLYHIVSYDIMRELYGDILPAIVQPGEACRVHPRRISKFYRDATKEVKYREAHKKPDEIEEDAADNNEDDVD